MSILSPEIGTTYGAIDSTAFTDGRPFGAHMLRSMIRGRNRLVAKGHEVFNLAWPVEQVDAGDSTMVYPFSVVAPPFWVPMFPPINVPKKPGLTSLRVFFTALINGSETIQVQVATRAQPFRDQSSAYTEFTADGDDDFDQYLCDAVPASADDYERIQVWFRGVPSGTLVSTGTVGTPNTSTSSSMVISPNMVVLSSASWNAATSATNNLAENGTAVVFNGQLGPVAYPRLVIDVQSDRFTFAPDLTLNELADARLGQDFDLIQLPQLALANLGGYLEGRTV